jgi:hypothetical protein
VSDFKKIFLLIIGGALSSHLFAAPVGATTNFDFEAENYRTKMDTRETEAWGNVRVSYLDSVLTADRVIVKAAEHRLVAEGNIVLQKDNITLRAKSGDIDLSTGFGTFHDAVLRKGTTLILEARKLAHYEKDRYRAVQAKVSTCQDCPQAWSVTGASMDVEIEGFLEVHHALFQVQDVPFAYLPIFIYPVKTKRQSGFLMPRYSKYNELGHGFEQPYYWAMSKDADTTFNYQYLSNSGHRLSDELRYRYSDRSFVESQVSKIEGAKGSRHGVEVQGRAQLSPQTAFRLRSEIASDPRYTVQFPGDFRSANLPSLESEPSLSWQNRSVYVSAYGRYEQDNLLRDSRLVSPRPDDDIQNTSEFEPYRGSLNVSPGGIFGIPATPLVGPILGGTEVKHMSFRRRGSSVDRATGWIREGDRTTLVARASSPLTASFLEWDPSIESRSDFYRFPVGVPGGDSAWRTRIIFDQTVGSTFARVYDVAEPENPQRSDPQKNIENELRALKHTVRPYLRHTYSGRDGRSKHPFFGQGNTDTLERAPQFDIFDPEGPILLTPLGTASEEQRLRENHLITLGFETRLIGRFGESNRRYDSLLGVNVTQDVDFFRPDPRTGDPSLGPLIVNSFAGYRGFRIDSAVAFKRDGTADTYTRAAMRWRRYYLAGTQNVRQKLEFYTAEAAVSNMGSWSASVLLNMNRTQDLNEQKYTVAYASKSSQCWYANLGVQKGYGETRFNYLPEIGFIVTDGGDKQTMNSIFSNRVSR